MSGITELFTGIRGVIGRLGELRMPEKLDITYPEGTLAPGATAGRFLLTRGAHGAVEYKWSKAPTEIQPIPAFSELQINHAFNALESLAAFIQTEPEACVFVETEAFEGASLFCLLDPEHPELGSVSMPVERHPAWQRWAEAAGNGVLKDLDHVTLADLLLDNQEDLAEPMIAKMLASFRSARTIEHVANHDTGEAMGVRVSWKGSAGSDVTKTDTFVPREFTAQIPAYVGAWPPGMEPKHEARFRLRVVPPRGDRTDAAPTFRIVWLNARDFELAAAHALSERVKQLCTGKAVYIGSPEVKRFVSPTAGA